MNMTPITRILYILLGSLIAGYTIYIRLILTRVPRELYLFEPTQYRMMLVMFIWIIISIYMIYKSILILNNSIKENRFTLKIMMSLSTLIDDAFKELYKFIAGSFTRNYEAISSFSKYFYKVFGSRNETILIIISASVRFIILFAFVVDVFIFFKLNYFYKSLILLCIPLIINIIIYILKDFASNLEEVKSSLIIKNEKGEIINSVIKNNDNNKEPTVIYEPSFGNEDIDLEYHVEEFKIISKIEGYLKVYDFLVFYYTPRINLIIYSLYLFYWFYVFIFNFS